jgi:hypothetical protein
MNVFKYGMALIAVSIIVLMIGCGDALVTPGTIHTPDVGGGAADGAVPGSNTLLVADLDKNYNAVGVIGAETRHGMRLVTLTQADSYDTTEITTMNTLGLWDDDKFHIQGFTTGFGDGYRNQGFVDVLLLYYTQAFEANEEFTISARIRMKRVGGVSTSKGIHFGAYTDRTRLDTETGNYVLRQDDQGNLRRWGPNQDSKGVGMFFRGEAVPQFRMYYSCQMANSTTAGTSPMLGELTGLNLGREYVYEISRTRCPNYATCLGLPPSVPPPDAPTPDGCTHAMYRFRLLDSKTYRAAVITGESPNQIEHQPPNLLLRSTQHPVGTPVQMHHSLRQGVYAGITIAASNVEISQIKIWDTATPNWNYDMYEMSQAMGSLGTATVRYKDGGAPVTGNVAVPIFWTPDTKPAYVPADRIVGPGGTNWPAFSPVVNPIPGTTTFEYSGTTVYNELVNRGGIINIIPVRSPSYAEDDIWFEFFQVNAPAGNTNHPAFLRIEGDAAHPVHTHPGVFDENNALRRTYERGRIVVDLNAIPSGQTASAWFKIVGRDLTLEVDEIRNSFEYPLLQTLPEYLFRVNIVKP